MLRVTPVIYANQNIVSLTDSALTIIWKRKNGSNAEIALTEDESVNGNVLTVKDNIMSTVASGLVSYVVYVSYIEPENGITVNATADISFAQVKTGENAKSVWISGEQVFKYSTDGTTCTPSQISQTANLQNVSMGKWQYKNESGNWVDYPTTNDNATISNVTLIVKPTHSIWVNNAAAIKVTTSDSSIEDNTSIYKISDGASGSAGESASIAFLTNENVTFAANANGKVPAATVRCNVVAYTGTTKVTPVIGEITGAVDGMTVSVEEADDNEIPIVIVIESDSDLGGEGAQQGVLNIPVSEPVSTTLVLTWSKVNTGAAGSSSVVFTLFAPEGTVFVNGKGNLSIETAAYYGSSEIVSGAAYKWEQYKSGSWNLLSEETGSSIEVAGSDVAGVASFRCTMTYNGQEYQDIITLIDKVDNYQQVIDSTAGNVFKNTVGETVLIGRLWQAGEEVDVLKSKVFSVSSPGAPTTGSFYYKIDKSTPQIALMRYSGSVWVDVTESTAYKHEKEYTWYRRDGDGDVLDGGAAFATGKLIYIDGDDVDNKTVFVCEVN